MAGFYKWLANLSWWLGIISLLAGFLTKLVKPSGIRVFGSVTAHSLLFFAGVLFLCALATLAMEVSKRQQPIAHTDVESHNMAHASV